MTKKVITRFAPSPTGHLHLGGARTALFAWLFSKSNKGKCLLRIEDTDKDRSKEEYTNSILKSFSWMGIEFDEEPVYQSKNISLHLKAIEKLIEEGHAYYCHCSQERLDKLRKDQQKAGEKPKYDGKCRELNLEKSDSSVVRFKNSREGAVTFNDLVRGEITISNNELDDLIILRSDGSPTYNLSVVVDDMNMGITHVIRGDDHINNTPRQINICKALGGEEITFGHVPMILGDDGKRMSKRHGAISVVDYKNMGILSEAFLNYLVRLGWSLGDKEVFTLDELINCFSEGKINSAPSSFSMEKLTWFNKEHLDLVEEDHLLNLLSDNISYLSTDSYSKRVIGLVRDRCSTLLDFQSETFYFFQDYNPIDNDLTEKFFKPESLEILSYLQGELAESSFTSKDISEAIEKTMNQFSIGMGKVGQPFRLAITGQMGSPSIDKTAELLGKEKVLERLEKIILG